MKHLLPILILVAGILNPSGAAILDAESPRAIEPVHIETSNTTASIGWIDSSMFADFETTTLSEQMILFNKADDRLATALLSDKKELSPFDPWNMSLDRLSVFARAFPYDPELIHRYASKLYKADKKQEAIQAIERLLNESEGSEQLAELYMGMLVIENKLDKAMAFSDQAKQSFPESKVLWFNTACAYAKLGQTEEALHHLGIVIQMNWPNLIYLLHDSDLDSIRSEARFRNLQDTLTFRLISNIFSNPNKNTPRI